MKKTLWILVGVAVIGAVVFIITGKRTSAPAGSGGMTDGEIVGEGDLREAAVIAMTDQGFEPSKVTIKRGETIRFVNVSKTDRWPASNIHPTHGIYPEFDSKEPMVPGEFWWFTFDKAGIWKFHDHLFPNLTGTVVVE